MGVDLLLVSIDTISQSTCSILYQLATRPEEQEKIYQELKINMPDPDTPLTMSLLEKNRYMKGFIKEVLRVYSTIIGNGRTLQKDTVICGYKIPKGVQVIFPNLVVGNMEKYVSNADQFKPERWIKSPTNQERIHPFASLPFGCKY
jgi:cytochrome P450